jgi:hypothetical protein
MDDSSNSGSSRSSSNSSSSSSSITQNYSAEIYVKSTMVGVFEFLTFRDNFMICRAAIAYVM